MKLRFFCAGMALTSGASIALSLLLTRIFSVTMYYHFAFLLISLALLGIAVSGVAIHLLPRLFRPERLPWLAGAFAAAVVPSAILALHTAVKNPLSVDLGGENLARLTKLYFATALPFLASGLSVSAAIAAAKERIGRVYAFDLGGAALGCLLVIPLISWLGAPSAVLAAAAFAGLGGALFAFSAPTSRASLSVAVAAGLLTTGALTLLAARGSGDWLRIAQGSKFLSESGVIYERWNAFSRVTVSRSGEADHLWLHIDADAATRMFDASVAQTGYEAPRRFSEVRTSSLVYALRREGPALIIGPGGGPDVLSALRAGVPRIVGVEVNPLIADDIMRGAFASFNGDLYRHPGLEVVVDDGRSFIRRSKESYSSIQATLVDTWAASAAGAFTLSENNLYTAEAFAEYLAHLAPGGVLSMTRWYGSPPREFLRLVALGREGLERRGVPTAELPAHFFVAADARMATLLLKRDPFTPDEVALLRAECDRSQLAVLFSPVEPAGADRFLAAFLSAPSASTFLEQLPFDATPTTDDRPFFFYTMRRGDFARLLGSLGGLDRNNLGQAVLQLALIASVALTLLLVVLPLALLRRRQLREASAGKGRVLGFFLALGLGYILVEMGLMQRFVLFLGHPLYALAAVLATLLGSSGLGSALSPALALRLGETRGLRAAVGALVAVLTLYALGLGPLFQLLLPLPLAARAAATVALVALPGLLMGMLLPGGLRIATRHGADLVPWAWGLNGATSVVGSVLAVALSMHFGFTVTLCAGMAAYVLGAWVIAEGPETGQTP